MIVVLLLSPTPAEFTALTWTEYTQGKVKHLVPRSDKDFWVRTQIVNMNHVM